jgi:EmrB/QacA subfamily drug resistance transporter
VTGRATRGVEASPGIPWPPLLVVFAGVFMAIMDGSIVVVAAPAIQQDLHATDAGIQLNLAGYTLTYAVTLVIGGRLGDHLGRRRVFVLGVSLFTLASVVCGLAPAQHVLITARLVQGVGAALLFPQAFSTIQVLVPPPGRPRAFGALAVAMGSSTLFGQLLGGLLVQADLAGLSWRPVFLINLPIGALTVLAAVKLMPESKAPQSKRLDLAGAAVLAVALFLLVLPLIEGRQLGWPWWVWACFAGAALVLALFARVERGVAAREASPLVDFALFRNKPFSVGLILVGLWYTSINSFFLVLALLLQDGLGLTALQSGLVFAPFAVTFVLSSLVTARLAGRLGIARLFLGVSVSTVAFALMSAVSLGYGRDLRALVLVPLLVLLAVGNGFFQTPLLNAVLERVSDRHVGTASGLLSTAQQVGMSLGVALIGVVFYPVLGSAARGDHQRWAAAFAAGTGFTGAVALTCLVLLTALGRATRAAGRSGRPRPR